MSNSNEAKLALNRALYRRCVATFTHVRVQNRGEKQLSKNGIDLKTGEPKLVISHPGEYYAICCPFCNDTRFRCYINHMYGTEDHHGDPRTYLAICFNAGCPLSSGTKRDGCYARLAEMLLGRNLHTLQKANIQEGKEVDVNAVRADWPGDVTRIDKLPSTHAAVVYLAGRGFDPEYIGKFYNVHYCTKSTNFICKDRLIIPIYHNKHMVGWQARAPYDTDWKLSNLPKYYTAPGTPRRHILYNLRNAMKYRVGIIVEGVTDVWKVGPQAMCTLGATLTQQQQTLLVRHFKDYAAVLLYDPDVKMKMHDKIQELVATMQGRLKSGFCQVDLPDGTDPGSLSRDFLRPYITQQAAEHGMQISWNKR